MIAQKMARRGLERSGITWRKQRVPKGCTTASKNTPTQTQPRHLLAYMCEHRVVSRLKRHRQYTALPTYRLRMATRSFLIAMQGLRYTPTPGTLSRAAVEPSPCPAILAPDAV